MTGRPPLGEKDLTGTSGVAWDDAATRRAWWRQTGRDLLILGACAAWWAWYATTTVAVRERVALLTVLFYVASLTALPSSCWPSSPTPGARVRRLLRAHPWHTADNPRRGTSGHAKARDVGDAWFEVPDPGSPGRRLPLIIKAPLWWARRMEPNAPAERRAQIARLWYCGLPGDQVVIAGSRTTERAPRRLRHRHLLGDGTRDAPRLAGRVVALLLVWPAVVAVQVAEIVADDGHDMIGLFVMAALFEVTLLPFHLFLIVATRRTARTLAQHPWRPVDCEIRSRGRQQPIRAEGRTLTPSPFRVYVDERATGLWMAGDPQGSCVVSAPGGAEPARVAMSTTDNRRS